jgi:hypothetical protein
MTDKTNTQATLSKFELPSIDTIIKKVQGSVFNPRADQLDQVVVRFTRSDGQAEIVRGGAFSLSGLLGRSSAHDFYLVDNYPSIQANYQFLVQTLGKPELSFSVKYAIQAMKGRENLLIAQLARRNAVKDQLHDLLVKWALDGIAYLDNTLYSNLSEFARQLSDYLAKQAEKTGLSLSARVLYNYASVPDNKTIQIKMNDVQVQPMGYTNFVTISFQAVLIPDQQASNTVYTALGYQYRQEFEPMLTNGIQQYIRQHISYNELVGQLQGSARTGLMQYWNRQLQQANKGWVIGDLQVNFIDTLPAEYNFEQVEAQISLPNAKIMLTNTVIMNLDNAELFKKSGIDDLEGWIKKKLESTAQNVLANVSYAELVSQFRDLAKVIKSDLNKETQRIGYRVEYLLTSDMINDKLNFDFDFEPHEQEFNAALNQSVKLNIHINGRIRSLDHSTWRRDLKPDTDFVKVMKTEVLRLTRQTILRLNPNEFYTEFDTKVADSLAATIRNMLVAKFNVDETVDIAPEMEVDGIRGLIIELQNGYHNAAIDCFKGGATLEVVFSVAGIDPATFPIFVARSNNTKENVISNLARLIKIHIENAIHTHVREINVLRHPLFIKVVKGFAIQSFNHVRNATGILVEIIDVNPLTNAIADDVTALNIELAKSRTLKMAQHIDKLQQMLIEEEDPEEIARIDKQISQSVQRMRQDKFESNQLSIDNDIDDVLKLAGVDPKRSNHHPDSEDDKAPENGK